MFLFCFVLLESSGGVGETPNAFIFSLNNFEGLAPFVSKVENDKTKTAIDRSADTGPVFGKDVTIFLVEALAETKLGQSYSAPALVKNKDTILDGHKVTFKADEVEVFYLDPSR